MIEFFKKRRHANIGIIILLLFDFIYLYFTNNLQLFSNGKWNEIQDLFFNTATFFGFLNSLIWGVLIVVFVFPSAEKKIVGKLNELLKHSQQSEKRDQEIKVEIEKVNQQNEINQKEILRAIQENAAKQGITKTEEELIQENKELRAKLQKESVVSIGTKLQTKLDKLFSEFRYEEFRNTIDNFFKKSDQNDLAKLHYQKALAYEAEINYPKAKEELATAVALDKTNPDILQQYGMILYKVAEYEKALKFHKKALDRFKEIYGEEDSSVAVSYNNIGLAWKSKGEYDKAIGFYKKALKIFKDVYRENHPSIATSYNNIGSAWNSKGEYDQAIDYFEKALKILRKVHPNGHPYIDITERSLKIVKQAKNK